MATYECEFCGTKCNECINCEKLVPIDHDYWGDKPGIFCDEDCYTEYYEKIKEDLENGKNTEKET